ncbi:hypothetical protein GCM10028807_51750 [Spirosoma daeguense]
MQTQNETRNIAGYLVTDTQQPQAVAFFTDPNLLEARRRAFSYQEKRVVDAHASQQSTDMRIQLIETAAEHPLSTFESIAMVFQQELLDVQATGVHWQQQACEQALGALHQEYAYYLTHQHAVGMGYFQLVVESEHEIAPYAAYCILADALAYSCVLDSALNPYHWDRTLPERYTITTFRSWQQCLLIEAFTH